MKIGFERNSNGVWGLGTMRDCC